MRRNLPVFAVLATASLALSSCGATDSAESAASQSNPQTSFESAEDGQWPRTIEHAAGSTTIEAAPVRIVSTSPSITGSLLAIDAPLVATGATTPSGLSDDDGFFTQWADIAHERGVEVAYTNLELDLDAIDLLEPDLIIGSANGGDSSLDAYDQLSEIAPTVLFDYGTITWQDLTEALGEATGLEDNAANTLSEYDQWVSEQAELIDAPTQPATALVYLGADGIWAFSETSPQAELLESLGFTYQSMVEEYVADAVPGANGVDTVTPENMAAALSESQIIFPVSISGADPVAPFVADPLLANQEAVADDQVFSLGSESFRLDYYSAKNTVSLLVNQFGK